MAALFNDGNIPYGCRILKLSSSLGTGYGNYVGEQWQLENPTISIKRSNEMGEPVGAVYIRDWKTGTATVQLTNTSSQIPQPGDTYMAVFSGSTETKCIITSVSQPESNTTDKKVNIAFSQVIN